MHVAASTLPWLIIRTAVVYGAYRYFHRTNRFIDDVLDRLCSRQPFAAMEDVINSPTFVVDLCHGLLHLMDRECRGTYHVAGSEPLSKYRLAAEIADIFGLDGQLVVPTKRSVQANLSMYPGDTSLDVSKLSATGFTPMKVSEGLRELQTVSL